MTTSNILSQLGSPGVSTGFKNRLINGNMVIDQRNNGASVTPASSQYLVDRFAYTATQASKFTAQQNAGSVTLPIGFTNYLGMTVASAVSVAAGDTFLVSQNIEGLNIGDLSWGTANAKTVTLSFQVYSSLTGTFGGALTNSATNRSYPFSYTVSSANTWTQISVTIAGDTSGTWLTTNGIGIVVRLGLGSGTTYSGTAGAWAAGNIVQPTGTVSVVGTNGATFYITGVQLEVGTTATNFDYRSIGTELALCQRYYQTYAQPPLRGTTGSGGTSIGRMAMVLPVVMRATPSSTVGALPVFDSSATGTITSVIADYSKAFVVEYDFNISVSFTASRPCMVYQSGSTTLQLSAEL
jgi:hypothetical protein